MDLVRFAAGRSLVLGALGRASREILVCILTHVSPHIYKYLPGLRQYIFVL